MADILRPALVSQRQQKRPIAPAEAISRPLTLVTAPATLDLPLRSGRLFESAPGNRNRWQPDCLQSQGFIVYDGPEAAVAQLSDSAPQARRSLLVEQPSNLLTNTLAQSGLGLPLLAIRIDVSAPARRAHLVSDQTGRALTLGINPNAAVVQLSDSANPQKRSAYGFDPPNLLTLGIALPQTLDLPLRSGRSDASAPAVKYQVKIEALSRPLTLGIDLPLPGGIFGNLPIGWWYKQGL